MKRYVATVVVLCCFLLVGCDSTVTSENGYDITELDACIDTMVDDDMSTGCANRNELMEAYVRSYEEHFVPAGTTYTDSGLEFSSSRGTTSSRLRYWFQYTSLNRTEESNNYDTYKDIVQTIVLDLTTINDTPGLQIEGEFFHSDGYHFIFERWTDETFTGEIQIYDTQVTIDVVHSNTQAYIDNHGIDDELDRQTFQIMASDHAVIVVVDVVNDTYQYKIFRTDSEDTNTIADVETLIETTFNGEGVTLEPWTID